MLPPFRAGNDPRNTWESWIKAFERYMSLNNVTNDKKRLDYLLVMGGMELQECYDRTEKYDVHLSIDDRQLEYSAYESAKETLEQGSANFSPLRHIKFLYMAS